MGAAGVADATTYLFQDVAAPDLAAALAPDATSDALAAMRDVAGNSARDMQRLADLSENAQDWRLKEVALDIAESGATSPDAALCGLQSLLRTHRAEWQKFLRRCGTDSWIKRLAEA